jgi:hypothetical protein
VDGGRERPPGRSPAASAAGRYGPGPVAGASTSLTMVACQKASLTSISGRTARSSPASRARPEVAGQSAHAATETKRRAGGHCGTSASRFEDDSVWSVTCFRGQGRYPPTWRGGHLALRRHRTDAAQRRIGHRGVPGRPGTQVIGHRFGAVPQGAIEIPARRVRGSHPANASTTGCPSESAGHGRPAINQPHPLPGGPIPPFNLFTCTLDLLIPSGHSGSAPPTPPPAAHNGRHML